MVAASPIQLVVGLGNPGRQYEYNRHNAGKWFVRLLAETCQTNFKLETKFKAEVARVSFADHNFWIICPTTYMNESGLAVRRFANFYKIPAESILVAHDELDFPAGAVRLKQGGGAGGHNGLRSIINQLGSKDFLRLRIGIGHPGDKSRVHDYVLSNPKPADFEQIIQAMQNIGPVLEDILAGNIENAMTALH